MSRSPSPLDIRGYVDRLEKSVIREECLSCDCFQGLLTQIELDFPTESAAVARLKIPSSEMHGCLGCDPCPPGALYAEYLRMQNESFNSSVSSGDSGDEICQFVLDPPDNLVLRSEAMSQREEAISAREQDFIRDEVRKRYAEIADQGSCCAGSCVCSAPAAGAVETSARLGYSNEELAAAPDASNLGLGCGNPQAIAALKKGETALDLGSGAGFDCFLAARRVGKTGRVIGVDMTPEMIGKARSIAREDGIDNVEFRLGEIEHLPVADNSVDVIISNCVINLSPDKPQVYADAYRVLREGGRLAISDVVMIRDVPDEIKRDLEAYSGCIAGAASVSDVKRMLHEIGFVEVRVAVKEESREFIKDWFPGSGAEDYVRSAAIEAVKGREKE